MLSIVRVRQLAIILGILLPLAETIRRSSHLGDWWLWLDDYLIGASLLFGAGLSRYNSPTGLRALAAAWGLTSGMGYYSFVGHLQQVRERDVSGLPGATITIAIGIGLCIAVWALVYTVVVATEHE